MCFQDQILAPESPCNVGVKGTMSLPTQTATAHTWCLYGKLAETAVTIGCMIHMYMLLHACIAPDNKKDYSNDAFVNACIVHI